MSGTGSAMTNLGEFVHRVLAASLDMLDATRCRQGAGRPRGWTTAPLLDLAWGSQSPPGSG